MTELRLGRPAPLWTCSAVVNCETEDCSLVDYQGIHVVLFFYPFDFTPSCQRDILAFNEKREDFKTLNCQILACSTDSQYTHLAWVCAAREQSGLGCETVTLLADKNGDIARKYGVLNDEGVALRGIFIIDDVGILRHINISDVGLIGFVGETLSLVQALQSTGKQGKVRTEVLKRRTREVKSNDEERAGESPLPFKIRIFVYLSHTLSSWGDRMWSFGVGLFMMIISPDSLRLTAVYGLSIGGAVLLLGALVGDWIDRTPRLKAARTTLVIQNLGVLVCATCIFFVITFKPQIVAYWPDQGLLILCYAGIILIAVISNLASMGTKIALQRDWIVEICGRDKDALASMSATMRAIDLVTLTVAPILTGQIMTYASTSIGALFIGGWNLVSVFVEYYLLWKVYDIVPALKGKKYKRRIDKEPVQAETEETPMELKERDTVDATAIEGTVSLTTDHDTGKIDDQIEMDTVSPIDKEIRRRSTSAKEDSSDCSACMKKTFSGFLILIRGWKTYMKYSVAYAGLGLALLYMTVLGFDNITVGYAYSQGVTESIMGILMAGGGLVGILGALLYPRVRRRVGIERTGLFGFFLEVAFLCLCVASVWAPGSPFDPLSQRKVPDSIVSRNDTAHNNATVYSNVTQANITIVLSDASPKEADSESVTNISVWLLLAGIIGARCGLWMADLTITQMFLENVEESQRGIVNGVQTSLNQLMDILKNIMVVVAPHPEVFGILILISFGFIIIAWMFYAKYSYSVRGHLFHFDKIRKCDCGDARNNNVTNEIEA